jgi:MoxR-like ATPase
MDYDPIFTPEGREPPAGLPEGDRRAGSVYVYDEPIKLAVNVALATRRPLLVAGAPGSGKSSLAANVAVELGWRYYEEVISSRTEARDLLWRFDALRRLRDAQAQSEDLDSARYVEAGVLWYAFDQESAREHGHDEQEGENAVVLLDEIDKADPDVPNNLLVPLGSFTFEVTDIPVKVHAPEERRPFVVLTTNDERELPAAFTRRCIVLKLDPPDVEQYMRIARTHNPDGDEELHRELAELVVKLALQAEERRVPPPSSAEYLDAIRACRDLGIDSGSDEWDGVIATTLRKRRDLPEVLA